MARAYNQAQKFGAEMAISNQVSGLGEDGNHFVLRLHNGENVTVRAVVIASGARYRRLNVHDLDVFEASSVHYWASPLEAKLCSNRRCIGRRRQFRRRRPYSRRPGRQSEDDRARRRSGATMSRYLVDRIEGNTNIEVVTRASISSLEGRDGISKRCITGKPPAKRNPSRSVICSFSIGADPNTDWLAVGIRARSQGFRVDQRGCRRIAILWKRAAVASSPSATSRANRSNGLPPRSARRPSRRGSAFLSRRTRRRSGKGTKSVGISGCRVYRGDRAKSGLLTTGSARSGARTHKFGPDKATELL